MKTIRKEWIIWLALLAPLVFNILRWGDFPAQVPIHFNFDGEPDNFASKAVGLILLPAINIAVYFFLLVIPRIDPRKHNYALFSGGYYKLRLVLHLFLSILAIVTALKALNTAVEVDKIIMISMPILFIMIGNYISTVRPNYLVGVRTPWTLANDTVWVKTHRLTGKIWVGTSLLFLILALATDIKEIVMVIYLGIIVIIPIAYSYIIFTKLEKSKKKGGEEGSGSA